MLHATEEERAELVSWVETFGDHVRRREFEDAAVQFDREVVSFSSLRDVVVGLPELMGSQWRQVWPTIEAFRFDTSSLHAFISPDGRLAVVAVTWTSVGFDRDGQPFDRPGRATIALGREPHGSWHGIHAHFSLNRGVPQMSFGSGPPQ